MSKALFHSMQEQMRPSGEARAALTEKLARTKKRAVPAGRYVAIAACAAVLIAAVPVYRMIRDSYQWRVLLNTFERDAIVEITKPHSYAAVTVPAEDCMPEDGGAPESSTATGGAGDRDMDMTPGELTDNMLEAGFTQEDVDGYLASGWQMTWAKWYKFCHLTKIGDRTLDTLLDFSREEGLAVNTGEAPEMPGGAYVGDAPDQGEAVMAYQNLMARFEADYGPDRYPEWYGGAYIDEHAGLIVNIVVYYEERLEDKELYLQIQDWAGSDRVGFGSCGLSLNQLKELQNKTNAAMEALGLGFGCGINEEAGQVTLTLYQYSEEALWKLAELDPADTAIDVLINDREDIGLTEDPVAPSVSRDIQPGGADPRTPVSNLPGMTVDEDGVIAYEPQG